VAVLRCWEQCEERKATRSWQEISWLRMALFSWDKKQALIRVGNSRAESCGLLKYSNGRLQSSCKSVGLRPDWRMT
jgi:hypothetical protein